jgi:glycosyltransferase involved in cell wall biosynthesis
MFCSTIIPIIGRTTLSRAVNSVLIQSFTADDFEIIVVNNSGNPLAKADWQTSEKVCILNTNRHERSTARNTGATVAKGTYLHFLDDDWLLPGALQSFWELAQRDNANWLYGCTQLID